MNIRTAAAVAAVLALAGSARAGDDTAPAPAAPAPAAKHENKITPEAKAAFEKLAKISNSPVEQGLKDASGTITLEMMGMPMSMAFTFKAPATVHVEPDANAEGPMKQAGTQMAHSMERSLKSMLGIFRPADDEEYDASLATVDGKEVLSITTYKDGVEEGRSDLTLDANGLPVTGTTKSQMGKGAEKHEMQAEVTFTWTKSGERYRLEKMETAMAGGGRGGRGGMGGGKFAVTYTYTDIEKFALATSWKSEMVGSGMTFESRISDLVVNGKKVEVKAVEGAKKATPKMGKGDKGDDDGEDDGDDDEGGEKNGKGGKK